MKLFRSKRGDVTEVIMEPALIMAIIFGVIFLTLLGFISKLSVSRYYENTYIASYAGLTLESLYPSSGTLMFDSNLDTFGLTINFSNGRSESYDDIKYEGATKEEKAFYMFTGDPTLSVIAGLVQPVFKTVEGRRLVDKKVKLRLLKQGSEIFVGTPETIKPDFNRLDCPDLEISGEEEQGFFSDFVQDKRELDRTQLRTIVARSPVAVLITKNPSYKNNMVVAYFSPMQEKLEQKRALACSLLNNIMMDTKINSIMNVSDVAMIPTEEFPILSQGNIAVLLEFRTEEDIGSEEAYIENLVKNV